MSALRLLVALVALVGCSGERERAPGNRIPSCSAPICGSCSCDTSFSCESNCSCDPECGSCRVEGAQCREPADAGPAGDASDADDDGGTLDAGPCEFPPSQGLSMPCCTSLGIDACGAGLFCAAFDGRTQPTCYAEHSRADLETCTADVQCLSSECDGASGKCRSSPDGVCETAVGCASFNGARYGCDARDGSPSCSEINGRFGAFCLEDADCDSTVCGDSSCLGSSGQFCNDDVECASGRCYPGTCACAPLAPTFCAADQLCLIQDFTCIDAGTVGLNEPCSVPEDCASPGQCYNIAPLGQLCYEPCSLPNGSCTGNFTCRPFGDEVWGLCAF